MTKYTKFTDSQANSWTHLKWTAINSRAVNGLYANNPSIRCNPQQKSYHAKGIRIEMTKEEFFDFCASNENKIVSIFKNGDRPSLDRIDNEGHYSLDNIQIITLQENLTKDRSGDSSNHKKANPTVVKIKNRQVYIDTHTKLDRPLVIDRYIRRVEGFHFGISLLSDCINDGIFDNAFDWSTNDYSNPAVDSIVDEFIEESLEKKRIKEAKIARILAEKERIQKKKAEKEAKLALRKSIKENERYDEVYSFVTKRKALLSKGKAKSICELDSFLISNNTRNSVIHIITNNIETEVKSVVKKRIENKADLIYKGISFEVKTGMYLSQFTFNKKKYWVGRFENQEDALVALQAKKKEIKGN